MKSVFQKKLYKKLFFNVKFVVLRNRILHIYFLLFAMLLSFAQDPKSIKLTEKEGLPDIEFYDITKDQQGLIWLAADKGLFSFNGKEYQSYNHNEKRGLSVFGLKFDPQNRLWCNNISGQFFFIKNNTLELFLDLKNELRGELPEFTFLNNSLYIFCNSKIYVVDLKTKERKKIALPISNKKDIIRGMFFHDNTIYFTLNNSIYHIHKNKEAKDLGLKIAFSGYNIFQKFFTFKNTMYLLLYDNIKNENTFYKMDKHQLETISIPAELRKTKIITISEIGSDLWFCTVNGIAIVQKKNSELILKNRYFQNDFITKTIIDKDKTVWVSTLNNGIYILPSLQIKWLQNVTLNDNIATIEKISSNRVAVGTTNGNVFLQDLNTDTKERIDIKDKRKISSLLYLKNKNTLIISNEAGVYSYALQSKKIHKLQHIMNAKDLESVQNSDAIIYSDFNKASVVHFKNNRITPYKILNNNRAYRAFSDYTTNRILVSYVDNLRLYDSNLKGTILKYNNKSIIAKDICQTNDKTIWIASFSDGILGIKKNKFQEKLDINNGLKSKIVLQISGDGSNLWIVTDKGIQVYDTHKKQFIPTLISNSANLGNIKGLIVNEQNILFATQQDFFVMDKNSRPKVYSPKEILIQSVTINEKDTVVKPFYSLPYDKNRIKINFHTNGYYPEGEISFQYRLLGLNENWIATDNKINSIYFNSLPPKDYVLEIRTKSNNNKGYIYKKTIFQIQPPFWKKWWFIVLVLFSAFGIIILFYKNKLAIQEKEKEIALKNAKFENELAILKLENLKSQMNPHFIFNALNSIQEYIILNQKNLASSYLAKFSDLIRAYLEHSSKGYITLREEIECLNIYLDLEKLRFEEKFSFKIAYTDSDEAIKIPTMLIQPYVENAIKHGLLHKKDNRLLEVSFKILKEEQMLQCIILDNGIGRERAAELRNKTHQSFATKANQNRLELLNFGREKKIGSTTEDLKNDRSESIGTKVTLLIPILK